MVLILNCLYLQPALQFAFQKTGDSVKPGNSEYDYGSTMHYGAYSFAVFYDAQTIRPKLPGVTLLTDGVSMPDILDYASLRQWYGCVSEDDEEIGEGLSNRQMRRRARKKKRKEKKSRGKREDGTYNSEEELFGTS